MKKLFLMSKVVAALVAATVVTGCSDEIVQPQIKSSDGELLSRGAYDYPAVEWDNVDYIAVSCDMPAKNRLSVPWDRGSTESYGIPDGWIDQDRKNSDPKKRAYSRQNGWEMVCHNLSDPTQSRKYFGLYNKLSGILRLFFYEISSASGQGTSNAWAGLRVSGSTALINFSGRYPLPMSDRMSNPMVFSSAECTIRQNNMDTKGYIANNWYGLEVELAYDANAVSSNQLSARLWGQYLTSISMTGTENGNIKGSVQTVYSNMTNINNNVSVSANIGTTTVKTGEAAAKEELEAKATKGGNFFNNLWNNIKGQIPQLVGKAAKEGIDALLSGGTTLITHGLSKLLGLSGRKTSSKPMTSTSKVDLGLTSQLDLTGTSSTTVVGFGAISAFDLPQFATNNQLYTGKLGVWNLKDYPKLYVDLLMTSMYYPKELVPNPSCPRAYYPTYTYTLSSGELVVNPDVLKDYKVENLWQDLVFTSNAFSSIGTVSKREYGIDGTHEYYEPQNGSRSISVQGEMEDFRIMNFNPNTSYERFWNGYDKPANGNSIMCHVYFELVSKTDSNERYAYSKYFPVKAVKRNYSHREETITQ